MDKRENWKPAYLEYIKNGGIISPMNTETCRKYLQEKVSENVKPEDVLWLFYHTQQEGGV